MIYRSLFRVLILITCYSYSLNYESRAVVSNLEETHLQLQNLGALSRGEYAFTDYLYYMRDKTIDLNKEFVRLRVYQKTNWDQTQFVIVHKIKEQPGKSGKILWHEECDSWEQVEQLLKKYDSIFLFSFSRNGSEYTLNGMRIFVEDIEGLPATVEIVADDSYKIFELFNMLQAEMVYDSVAQLVFKMQIYEQK